MGLAIGIEWELRLELELNKGWSGIGGWKGVGVEMKWELEWEYSWNGNIFEMEVGM